MPCEVCDVLLDTREAMPYVMGHRHFNSAICIINLKAELAEWRTGRRRVYWRIRYQSGFAVDVGQTGWRKNFRDVRKAKAFSNKNPIKITRVIVGPRGNVRPWRKK